jgi:WD40 repeat protein
LLGARWDPLRLPPNHFTALLIAAGATAISGGLLLLCPPPARPQPLSDKPFPAIEAGMHTAPIVRMGVDREGRYGVTASHDKTARLWDLRTGQQLAVLRVPLGDGNEGRLYAAALSPDGRWVALGGWTGPGAGTQSIYIFDRASGQIAHRIAALPNVIFHLAFSPDGRHLAAALGGPNGIRVFSAASWKPVAADSDYQDSSYSVHFARDGRLVATSLDGQLRLYNPSFETIARRPIPGGKQPFFARFSPDGSRIAVGFHDSTKVSVVSANDLTLLHTADTDRGARGQSHVGRLVGRWPPPLCRRQERSP